MKKRKERKQTEEEGKDWDSPAKRDRTSFEFASIELVRTEITKFDLILGIQHDVTGLDVSVQNRFHLAISGEEVGAPLLVTVTVLQGKHHLREHRPDPLFLEIYPTQQRREGKQEKTVSEKMCTTSKREEREHEHIITVRIRAR